MIYFLRSICVVTIALSLLVGACSFSPPGFLPPTGENTHIPAQKTAPGPAEDADEVNTPLGEAIDEYIRSEHPLFSGSVLVASQDQVDLSKGYRYSDWELETPNRRGTKYRIASLTKPITALAILILQERGLLDVHDPVCDYIPDCPPAWQAITIHHLLTHTSGIPDYTKLPDAMKDAFLYVKPAELVARFKDQPLEFTPGEGFSYSNSGYTLLGVVIEEVSRKPYPFFLEENIFGPLDMQDTGVDDARRVLKGQAKGYTIENNALLNSHYLNMSNAFAAGDLFSTVDDLYRLDQALRSDRLVTRETLAEIFTPYVEAPEMGGSYGYGWVLGESHGRRVEGHEGGIFGFHSQIERFPEEGATIVILSNNEFDDFDRLIDGIEDLVFPSP